MINNFEINFFIYIIIKIIVNIGALSWGLFAIDKKYNIVEMTGSLLPTDYNETFQKITYIIFALSAIYIMLQRKTFLPFLDVTIAPLNRFLKESKQKDFELEVVVNAKGSEKVLYWASNKETDTKKKDIKNKGLNKDIEDPTKAYGNFENSGISIVDKDGKAKLYIKCPKKYYVMYNKIIPQHLHYRTITNGKLDEVKTINISC